MSRPPVRPAKRRPGAVGWVALTAASFGDDAALMWMAHGKRAAVLGAVAGPKGILVGGVFGLVFGGGLCLIDRLVAGDRHAGRETPRSNSLRRLDQRLKTARRTTCQRAS